MRLLSVIHGPVFGGGHNQALRLREPLAEHGWSTLVAVPEEPGNALDRLLDAGVEVTRMRLRRLRATPDPLVQARFAAGFVPDVARLRRLIRDRDVDVVQVHGPTNPHAAVAAQLEGRAVVWQLYDTRTPMALRRAFMPLVTRLSHAVMSTGRAVAAEHPGAERLGDRLVPYVPPVDTRRFRPDRAARSAARARLGAADGDLVVATVGNRNPSKGHEYLLRAAARVRTERPDLRVWLLGAESAAHAAYERRLRDEAAASGDGAVAILDPGDQVAALLPGADVFALTSVPRSEGIPTVVLEAMACGLPVVASDVGSVSEVVEHGVNGLVVPPEDEAAVAGALARLTGDPELRARLAAEGLRSVRERFSLDAALAAHLRAYAIALERAGRGTRVPVEPALREAGG
jgi:glycosyltransferase involved in cell wall biosynthesis